MARKKGKITIELFPETRERMGGFAKKGESWDDYINRLMDKCGGK